MRPDNPKDSSAASTVRRISAILFDFHGTLAQVEPPHLAVEHSAAAEGVDLPLYRSTVLGDALGALGWVGSGQPAKVLPAFAQAWADRDLSEVDHREAFVGLASQTSGAFDGFADRMYDRLCSPEGWVAYPDTVPTLEAVRKAGIPIAVISNIGFDIRPVAKHLGFDHLIDHWVLSYEVRCSKPEPEIFREACLRLEVEPDEALMVGDSFVDAAATQLGIRTFLVPHTGPGQAVGLDAVLGLLGRG